MASFADMSRLSALKLLAAFREGRFTVREYAERTIARAKELDHLNNFVSLDETDLRNRAKEADERYAAETARPLEGLFVGLKDNIVVKGKQCSGASPALEGCIASRTATSVQRLLDAGAIDAGRLNMHELAWGSKSDNEHFGYVHNYFNYDYNCGGSSGGSANAVAADILPVTLGTDTCGSIRIPANACGVYGYRPTIDVWPSDFGLRLCSLRDSVGPIAASVESIALVDTAVSGNKHDLVVEPLTVRIGVPNDYFWTDLHPEIERGCERFLKALGTAGFLVIKAKGPDPQLIRESQRYMVPQVFREAMTLIRQFLQEHGMEDLSIENDVIPMIATPQVKRAFESALAHTVTDEEYGESLRLRELVKTEFVRYASDNRLDCWIFPTLKNPPPLLTAGDTIVHNGRELPFFEIMRHNVATAAMADQPGITMPCGRMLESGVPFGIEIDGPAGTDGRLVDIALAIERSAGKWGLRL